MQEQIIEIMKDLLDVEILTINVNENFTCIEDWDSLMQIRLIVALEREFNVKFNFDEIPKLTSICDIMQILKNRGISNVEK